jgi:beta-lactamase superfamily II metal-dependent hydrolase
MSPKHPARGLAASLLSLLLIVPAAHGAVTPNGRLQIIHMDVGQGDGTVIISPLGQVVMIDDGLYNNTPAPVAQLAALGVNHVVHHFASHYHADHIGAIDEIVASGVTIDYGWDRAQSYSSGTYTTYVSTLGAKRRTLVKNQIFMLDSLSAHPVTIKCVDLAGAGISTSDENSKSVVLKVSYGEFDEVFGGDLVGDNAGGTNIETTVGPEVGPVEVYKVHHHGSKYSSTDAWLNAITPKIGVIQCGDGNSYGHPTAEALGRLHAHGVKTYWNETGAGVAPNATWDRVAHGQVIIQATWEPGGVDTVRGPGFADTFTNSGTAVDGVPPTVAVTSPDGGETLAAGGASDVNWTASDNVAVTTVDIDYSLDNGGSWLSMASGIANSGTFNWPVPNAPSAQALVRVTAHDAAGNSASDMSDADFTVADQSAPVVAVTAPDGGEEWDAGSLQSVTWSASDNVGVTAVDVDYSLHGALGPWQAVQHGVANSGTLSWTLPAQTSDSALVRVTASDAALNNASDLSAALFRIVPSAATDVPGGGALAFGLGRPAPNPSRDAVRLQFSLTAPDRVRLEVLDVLGRRVWGTEADADAGLHTVLWDGRNATGGAVGQGLYFVRLTGRPGTVTAKLVRMP